MLTRRTAVEKGAVEVASPWEGRKGHVIYTRMFCTWIYTYTYMYIHRFIKSVQSKGQHQRQSAPH